MEIGLGCIMKVTSLYLQLVAHFVFYADSRHVYNLYLYFVFLKLCQNQKGQQFAGMLVFKIIFKNLNQLPAAKEG